MAKKWSQDPEQLATSCMTIEWDYWKQLWPSHMKRGP